MYYPWDAQAGTGIDIGAVVGGIDISFLSGYSCGGSIGTFTLDELWNASVNNSAANEVNSLV